MGAKEFIEKIKSGEAQVLTLVRAKELYGENIAYFAGGYYQPYTGQFKVGHIISEWDKQAFSEPIDGFKNRQEYWDSYMNKSQREREQNTMILMDYEGNNTFMKAHPLNETFYDEQTFTLSDADREVYFIKL